MKILRISFVFLVVMFSFCSEGFSKVNDNSVVSDFVSAGMDYTKGKYETAIEKYENIIKSGKESGAIYFNLGNSYYKIGQLGKAVLCYERALLFVPRDRDVKFNYKFVTVKLNQYAGNVTKKSLSSFINGFLESYSDREIILLGTFLFVGILFFHILSHCLVFFKKNKSFVLGALIGLFLFISFCAFMKVTYQKGLSIVLRDTVAYFEPRDDSTRYFDLPEGVKVKVVKDEFDWLKIKRLDGKLGWIKEENVERIDIDQ